MVGMHRILNLAVNITTCHIVTVKNLSRTHFSLCTKKKIVCMFDAKYVLPHCDCVLVYWRDLKMSEIWVIGERYDYLIQDDDTNN